MMLSALVVDFLKYLEVEQHVSPLTIRNYNHWLKNFLEWADDTSPKNIDLNLVRKYKLFLSQKPLKKVTQNYFLIALRGFLKFLAKQNIETLILEKVELNIQEPRLQKTLDNTELQQLLDAPDISKKKGIRDKAIMETLIFTGLRVSELTMLNRDSIPPSEWVSRYLRLRKDTFKPLFIRFQGRISAETEGESMRLTPRSIQRIVEKYAKLARLSVKATPQTLRYTAR